MYYTEFKTILGKTFLVGNENGLCRLSWENEETKKRFKVSQDWIKNDAFFTDSLKQLREYFAGSRKEFKLKINPQGTTFQKRVWNELRKIPYGELRSYQDVAEAVGNKNACRAVGMANSRNPLPIIIPCHRVIGKNGKLTGFSQGLDSKQKLLQLEKL